MRLLKSCRSAPTFIRFRTLEIRAGVATGATLHFSIVRLVETFGPQLVAAVIGLIEQKLDLRVIDRFAGLIGREVLLGHVSHVMAVLVLSEQMVERLFPVGTDRLGDRGQPFLRVGEFRIDVEDHAPERKDPVPDHLADSEFGESGVHDPENLP